MIVIFPLRVVHGTLSTAYYLAGALLFLRSLKASMIRIKQRIVLGADSLLLLHHGEIMAPYASITSVFNLLLL